MPPRRLFMTKLSTISEVLNYQFSGFTTKDLLNRKYWMIKTSRKNPDFEVFINTKKYTIFEYIEMLCQVIASRPDADLIIYDYLNKGLDYKVNENETFIKFKNYNSIGE